MALYLTHNHLRPLLGRRLADELIVEDAADDLVERLKRAKGGLDHGEQPLSPGPSTALTGHEMYED